MLKKVFSHFQFMLGLIAISLPFVMATGFARTAALTEAMEAALACSLLAKRGLRLDPTIPWIDWPIVLIAMEYEAPPRA